MADRCAELRRRSVAAIREAATTAGLIALTYEDVASRAEAAGGVDSAESHRDRASWARRRAAEERREAQRMWAQAAALESTET